MLVSDSFFVSDGFVAHACHTVETDEVVRCDLPFGGVVDALHKGFAWYDGPVRDPTDGRSRRADSSGKFAHRRIFGIKEVIEFHDLYPYVFRK